MVYFLSYFLSETYHVLSHIFCCSGTVVNIYRFSGMVSFHYFLYHLHKSIIVEDGEFCGVQLTFVDTVLHLGHTMSSNLTDSEDTGIKTKNFVRRGNCLLNF